MVNTVAKALDEANGIILGSAVHFASSTGTATSFFDRLFYCRFGMNKLKFGTCIVSCRRGGSSTTFDQLYLPMRGVRIMKTLANNMAYLIKCKHESKVQMQQEPPLVMTNFIR